MPQTPSEPKSVAMNAMKSLISSFIKDETAATAIEYALIAAGIAVAIIAIVGGLGSKVKTVFSSVNSQLR
jgi:pilus assembly protein Flp/PilA